MRYLHAGVRGDVRVVTDAAGSVTDTFSYSVDREVVDRTGTTPVTVGWNGEYTDPDTGMVWLRARWYDPASARFISADPWHGNPSVPVSLNRYLYANVDPVNNVDPTGLTTLIELNAVQRDGAKVSASQAAASANALRVGLRVLRDVVSLSVRLDNAVDTLRFLDSLGDPNDQDGIDGPGTVPDIEVHESDDLNPELQPQTGGAGARSGGPVRCEAASGWPGGDGTNDTIHSILRGADRDIVHQEVIENAGQVLYDENGNKVYIWEQPGDRSQVVIQNPASGKVITAQWSSNSWIARQLESGRWWELC